MRLGTRCITRVLPLTPTHYVHPPSLNHATHSLTIANALQRTRTHSPSPSHQLARPLTQPLTHALTRPLTVSRTRFLTDYRTFTHLLQVPHYFIQSSTHPCASPPTRDHPFPFSFTSALTHPLPNMSDRLRARIIGNPARASLNRSPTFALHRSRAVSMKPGICWNANTVIS